MNRMMVSVLAAMVVVRAANAMVVGISDTCARPHRADVMYYADTLERAGHVPVVLPYTADTNRIAAALGRIDCLLLTGGEDVEPSRYGRTREPKCGNVNVRRDAYDWALLDAAVARRLPVFGVCRGEQVINAYFGGTLIQHVDGHDVGPWDGDGTNAPAHVVKIAAGSRFARVMGGADLAVNSHHHQCVGRVAPGFRVVGTAPDGVVEAIEGDVYPAFAVQFHAESALANGARHPDYDKPRLLKLFREIPALVDCRSGGTGAKGGAAD